VRDATKRLVCEAILQGYNMSVAKKMITEVQVYETN